jgi:hypothetical protein
MLRRTFGPRRVKITGALRKLHSEKLHNLYSSLSVITKIKSRKMMGRALSTHIGEEECAYGFGRQARRKEATKNT